MDSVVEKAMRRRDELRSELHEIENFLKLYQKFSGKPYAPQVGTALVTASTVAARTFDSGIPRPLEQMWDRGETKPENQPPSTPSTATKGLSREQLRPHIEAVLREAGKPLTRGNLLKKLDQRGTPVGGEADRAKNMGTIMWRLKDQFINLPGYGYWIKGEPCPAADYDPELTDRNSDFDL